MKPKLRFPGFQEEWEEKKLGEVTEIKAGKDLDKVIDIRQKAISI